MPPLFLADHETGDLSQYSQVNQSDATLTVVADVSPGPPPDGGVYYAKAHKPAGSPAGQPLARAIHNLSGVVTEGSIVAFGARFYFPQATLSGMTKSIGFMGLDAVTLHQIRLSLEPGTGIRAFKNDGGVTMLLTSDYPISADTWHEIKLQLRYAQDGWVRLYLDGQLLEETPADTLTHDSGQPVEMTRCRWGIVSSTDAETAELLVYFDNAWMDVGPSGTRLQSYDLEQTPWPQGAIGYWGGTAASVPIGRGWEVADGTTATHDPSYTKPLLLGKFLRGVPTIGTAPGASGGATSHQHTLPSHSHTSTGPSNFEAQQNAGGDAIARNDHTHSIPSASGGTYDASAHDPPFISWLPLVYTIKPGASGTRLQPTDLAADALPPRGLIVPWIGTQLPSGYAHSDGSTVNGVATLNLLDLYLRGVPNGSTNPGATGGAASHTHTDIHTHAVNPQAIGIDDDADEGSGNGVGTTHDHTLLNANVVSSSANNDPPHVRVAFLTFVGHGPNAAAHPVARVKATDLADTLVLPRGMIFPWGLAIGSVPSGWGVCNGGSWTNGAPGGYGSTRPNAFQKFVKGVATAGTNGGGTGGSDTHGHTGPTHNHGTTGNSTTSTDSEEVDDDTAANAPHQHNTNNASANPQSSNHVPPYREVVWIVRD